MKQLPESLRDPMKVLARGNQIEECGGLAWCPAIHLVRIGNDVIVRVEIRGEWIELIREAADGSFSHIWEGDIYAAIQRSRLKQLSEGV